MEITPITIKKKSKEIISLIIIGKTVREMRVQKGTVRVLKMKMCRIYSRLPGQRWLCRSKESW